MNMGRDLSLNFRRGSGGGVRRLRAEGRRWVDSSHSPRRRWTIWPEVTERPPGTHKRKVQRPVAGISNWISELQIADRRMGIVPPPI